jgi:prolyl-tRNA editing enzyme YbaK/EbsC (Cys-tRNA(Pro) deacylase)
MNNPHFTPAELQAYITAQAIRAELLPEIGHTPTVPAAASALGVEADQIIKTLLFLLDVRRGEEAPAALIVIGHGERRVRPQLLAAHFGVAKGQVKLAAPEIVLAQLGYPAGGVPPFGHRTLLPYILDASVVHTAARFGGVLYGGGGDDRTMLRIHLDELLRITQPVVVAVSGGLGVRCWGLGSRDQESDP